MIIIYYIMIGILSVLIGLILFGVIINTYDKKEDFRPVFLFRGDKDVLIRSYNTQCAFRIKKFKNNDHNYLSNKEYNNTPFK